MPKLLAGLAAVPLFFFAVIAGTGVLVVDVRETGPDGHHFVLPVPLLLAQAAAGFVPEARTKLDVPDLGEYLPAAERLVQVLSESPDGEFVRVEDRAETVVVTKVGQTLQVRVHGRDEEVSVDVPLTMLSEVLRRCHGGRVAPADLVATLREARLTKLVEVRDRDTHVKVTVW